MGAKKNVDMSENNDVVKIVETDQAQETTNTPQEEVKKTKVSHDRSKKYKAVRSKVDKTRTYDPFSAIELVKKLSYSKFTGTITADIKLSDAGVSISFAFPHNTGKSMKVAVFSPEVLAQIEDGNIDFQALIATPADMPKLTKHARVLGPRGLMPNPKLGTLTDNPEAKKKELESGKVTLKSEKKAPLMHVVIGKTDMETKKLVENITALQTALKGKIAKLSISASMSPGVKVETATAE